MHSQKVHCIDLHFNGFSGTICSFFIPHNHGIILVESGPSSTLLALQSGLKVWGYSISDISDVLLTHIHLDHAGASGWLSRQGARIYVHPAGAPHLKDPGKLLASARRIYGDTMESLWGEFLPVLPERLCIPPNNEEIEIEGLRIRAVDTPGHADHHYVYLYEGTCFSGDVGGVRLAGSGHIRLPMPPPDFHPGRWRVSLQRLRALNIQRIAPTHFGIHEDPGAHLAALSRALDRSVAWIEATLPLGLPGEEITKKFLEWINQQALDEGVPPESIEDYEVAIPSWMSSAGIQRYWRKYREEEKDRV
jgi:glyoxylase-like metal-dependent hydrolase (beta-lactamase superfamily II)